MGKPISSPAIGAGEFQFSINEVVGAQVRALRLKQVMAKTGLGRSAIYAKAATGKFPAPFKLGGGQASAWLEHEIDAWLLGHATTQRMGGH